MSYQEIPEGVDRKQRLTKKVLDSNPMIENLVRITKEISEEINRETELMRKVLDLAIYIDDSLIEFVRKNPHTTFRYELSKERDSILLFFEMVENYANIINWICTKKMPKGHFHIGTEIINCDEGFRFVLRLTPL